MAQYSIQDTTLMALGDAVRNKVLGQKDPPTIVGTVNLHYQNTFPFEFNAAIKKVKIIGHVDWLNNDDNRYTLAISEGYYDKGYDAKAANKKIKVFPDTEPYDFEIELNGNTFTFHTNEYANGPAFIVLDYTIIGLDENGEEFKYSPLEMVNEINNFPTILAEAFNLTGRCYNHFSSDKWNWFIEQYGNNIITNNTEPDHMFTGNATLKNIPFDINMNKQIEAGMSYMFSECRGLVSVPNINNARPASLSYLFSNCASLREIPENFSDTWDFSYIQNSSSAYMSYIFNSAYSLRKIPQSFLASLWNQGTLGLALPYNTMFYSCYSLDEINGLAVQPSALTSNRFNNTFYGCSRIKSLVFQPNQMATWKSQIIDLTNYVGYASAASYITSYNSGITKDKKVYNDATYQALKDDPDWFTLDLAYSRYNHDSAVATINSLPDTSAYGTNTIKFKGAAGSLTDGGAINTLTTEEIAVATEKGWTVSFA